MKNIVIISKIVAFIQQFLFKFLFILLFYFLHELGVEAISMNINRFIYFFPFQ